MKLKTIIPLAVLLMAQTLSAQSNPQSVQKVNLSFRANQKVDLLFVVDNSATMQNSQEQLTEAIQVFIDKMKLSSIDYRIAVTATDAWRAPYQTNQLNREILSRVRPGEIDYSGNPLIYKTNSGVHVLNSETPNLSEALRINLSQGILGTGDERPFESFQAVLESSANSDFRRPDAHLSIIVITDEDDFSATTSTFVAGQYPAETDSDAVILPPNPDPYSLEALYRDERLTKIDDYTSFLEQIVGSKNFSVNLIGVLDPVCKTELNALLTGRRIARRVMQIVDATDGYKGSICQLPESISQYAETLVKPITVEPTYAIKLDKNPLVETIVVKINGRLISQNNENGWSFDESTLTLTLHGTAVPKKDDLVSITYDFVQPER